MTPPLYNLLGYNTLIFQYINSYTASIQHPLMFISSMFFFTNFIIYFTISAAICCKKIHNSSKDKQELLFEHYFHILFKAGIIYVLFILIYASLKYSVNLPRPYCSTDQFISIVNFSQERCLSSFPSAHSGLSIIITYLLWQHIPFGLKIISPLLVLIVGIARISLAMHYPSDVIYGYLIAIITIICGNFLYHNMPKIIIITCKNIAKRVVYITALRT
jgi:membrane-associated phospholipid phosphatase